MTIHLRPRPRLRAYCLPLSAQAYAERYAATDCPPCRLAARQGGFVDSEGGTGRTARAEVFTYEECLTLPTAALERAAAHMPDGPLEPDAMFRYGITDAYVARALFLLEQGTPFSRTANGRWFVPATGFLAAQNISQAVQEMIRTGLVTNLSARVAGLDMLAPAPVHLERYEAGEWRSACRTPGEGMGPKRLRLVGAPAMVDCLNCIS